MNEENGSALRKALLPLATTAVAVGAFLGLPYVKALAAAQELRTSPSRTLARPPGGLNIVQPESVNPSTKRLLAIAGEALSDAALAERIFREPDAVAAQYNLSENERLVLRHMTRAQFQTARIDARRVRATRLSRAGATPLPASATDARSISEGMIVGRAILAAMGRSYLEAANAHACCPWGKAIQLGLNAKRVLYDRIFEREPGLNLRQPNLEVPRAAERG